MSDFQHPYPTVPRTPAAKSKSNEVRRAVTAVGLFLVSLSVGGLFVAVSPGGFGLFMFLLFFVGGLFAAYKVRKGE